MFKYYKIYLTLLFPLLSVLSLTAQTISFNDSWGKGGFNLTLETPEAIEVVYSIQEFYMDEVDVKGVSLKAIHLPGVSIPNNEGAPDLAGSSQYIALPQNATASLNILSYRIETYKDVDVAPAPWIPLVTDKSPLDYYKDERIYSINAFYPAEPFQLSQATTISEVDPWSTYSNTPAILAVFGPDGLGYIPATPQELGGWSGGNATGINNAINAGAFFVQHNDHGGAFQTLYSEVPMNMMVEHDNVLLNGSGSFTVTADSAAFIALSFNGEIMGTAESDGTPQIINITPLNPGDAFDVVITRPNYFRYHGIVDVIPDNIPYVVYNDYAINDVSGNGDAILLDKALKAGAHSFQWNGTDDKGNRLTSGIYLFNLKTGSANTTKKVILH